MDEHERNLRDLAAMFAMMGLLVGAKKADTREVAETAYAYADDLMAVREEWMESDDDQGIAAIKPKRKYERKSAE